MEKKLEKLADDLMSLSKEDAQRLQIIIKAKLMPEVERQRGLLQQNPAMAQMGQSQQQMPRVASQRDIRMQGLLNRQKIIMPKHKMNKSKKVPKGYHKMPNGKLMKGAKHKSKKKY